MWGIFMLSVVCVCIPFLNCHRGFLVGPGRWLVLDIHKCDNPDQYEIKFDIKTRKKNRTHNCFDISMETKRVFDVTYGLGWGDFGELSDALKSRVRAIITYRVETWTLTKHNIHRVQVTQRAMKRPALGISLYYQIEIEVYQEVDGGFKFHHLMKFDSLCTLFEETAAENWKQLLTMANVDPPQCPLPAGPSIKVINFVMDYAELPEIGVYGTFDARAYVMYEEMRVGCFRLILNFEIRDDEENDEDNGGGHMSKLKSILLG